MRRHFRLYYPLYVTALIVLAFLPNLLGSGWGKIFNWMLGAVSFINDPWLISGIGFVVVAMICFIVVGMYRVGLIVIVPEMHASAIQFFGQYRRIISTVSLEGRGRKKQRLLGGLYVIGLIPLAYRLREIKQTTSVTLSEPESKAGEIGAPVISAETKPVKAVSLQDNVMQLNFLDVWTKNGVRMNLRFSLIYRIVGSERIFLATEDWGVLTATYLRAIVREAASKRDWPEIGQERDAVKEEVSRGLENKARAFFRPGGEREDRSAIQLLLAEYGVQVLNIEPGMILPTDQDIKEAGETSFKKQQEANGRIEEAKGLKGYAEVLRDDVVMRARELDIAQEMARNNRNINIGAGVRDIVRQLTGRE